MLTHPIHSSHSDWESYTPRQGHTSHSNQYQHRGDSEQQGGRYNNRGGDREAGGHGRHYGRMQHDDASGPMGEFSHSKGDAQQSTHANGRDGYLPGFQGVRRREGGPPGERSERGGDRPERHDRERGGDRGEGRAPYNKRYEDREAGGDGAVPRYANGESPRKVMCGESRTDEVLCASKTHAVRTPDSLLQARILLVKSLQAALSSQQAKMAKAE